MIKINIVCVGKVKEKYFEDGIKEYLKRLTRFADVSVKELKEENLKKDDAENKALSVKKESDSILKELKGYVIVSAIEGKKFTSESFSEKLKSFIDNGVSEITFVIGGSNGVSEKVKKKADLLLSFSDMTFPHTMFRLMLTEQIYRAFTIINGSNYHK